MKSLTLLFLVFSATLLSQGYTIENYDVQVEISKDGYYDIEEKIEVNFNEKRRGIFRNIPKKYSINGKAQKIVLSRVKVKDYKYKRLSEGNDYIIRVGNAKKYLTGRHKYIVSYRVANAYIYSDDHIAFQYNLISDWDAPIRNFTYKIKLPDDLSLSNDEVTMMTGASGERNKHLSLELKGRQISGRSLTEIPAKGHATIALKLPLGYVAEPVSPFSLEAAKRKKGWTIPLLLSILTFGYYKTKSKEEPLGQIVDNHFPPDDFSPPIVGAYYDHKVHTQDIISLLPYWANLGYVKILKGKDVLYFKKIKELPSQLPYYQKALFDKIFAEEDLVMLEDLNTKLGIQVANMKSLINKEIFKRELHDEANYKLFHNGVLMGAGIISIIAAVTVGAMFGDIFLVLSLALLGLLLLIIHASQPKLSEKGLRIKRHLLGLKQFLENGNPTKVSQLVSDHPDYFQQMYPYAIAFGIDKTWTNQMEQMNIPPPDWYGNYDGGSGVSIGSDRASRPSMKDFSQGFNIPEISSVFTSVPKPPPGSRGSSGGGFAGGGAGGGFGGGGGSW